MPVLVDGCQGAVHLPVDVRALDADFYVATGHKLYGPTGIGVLYGKRSLLDGDAALPGRRRDDPHRQRDGASPMATRRSASRPGTPPIAQAIGLAAAIDYVDGLGRAAIAAHENDLRDYADERLSRLNSVRTYGHAPGRGAIVSFALEGAHPHDGRHHPSTARASRSGPAPHCAVPLMDRLGVSPPPAAPRSGSNNTRAEVDRLADAIDKAHRFFA